MKSTMNITCSIDQYQEFHYNNNLKNNKDFHRSVNWFEFSTNEYCV